MSLVTGKLLTRTEWTDLPMPEYVVARVEAMGLSEGQPLMIHGEPIFEWAPGAPVEDLADQDIEDEGAYDEPHAPVIIDLGTVADPALDTFDEVITVLPEELHPAEEDAFFQEPDPMIKDLPKEVVPQEEGVVFPQAGEAGEEETAEAIVPETVFEEDGDEETVRIVEDDFPQGAPENAPRMNTRGNERSYGHCFVSEMDNPKSGKSYKGTQFFQQAVEELRSGDMSGATKHSITGFLMTQMTACAGIKKHGDDAAEAMFKEFLQLETRQCLKG
jgi:hypothetical protein